MTRVVHPLALSAFLLCHAIVQAGQPYLVSQGEIGNIWRLDDVNGDGDALDLGERTLWATSGDAFGGLQVVGGAVYVVQPDLRAGDGKIIRLLDLNGDGDALDVGESITWADSFVQPIDVAGQADGALYVTDQASNSVWRLVDANGDGDALDVSERTQFADAIDLPFMLLPWGDDMLVAAYDADEVLLLADANGDGDAFDTAEKSTILADISFPAGLGSDGSGGLFVTSINGDVVYRAQDRNSDGDFFDVAEVLSYADSVFGPIDGPWNMTAYANGGFLLADYADDQVLWMRDVNGDGDALDLGEVVPFADGINQPVDIVALPMMILVGDYNNNGTVDAADYVVWRKNEGTMNVLLNDPIGGTIGQGQYDQWRAHFGETAVSGSASSSNATVPEPEIALLVFMGAAVASWRRTRSCLFVTQRHQLNGARNA
jgi:hypothetical protein